MSALRTNTCSKSFKPLVNSLVNILVKAAPHESAAVLVHQILQKATVKQDQCDVHLLQMQQNKVWHLATQQV